MQHTTVEKLINYMDAAPAQVEKLTLDRHMAACAGCFELKQEIQDFMLRLQEDSSFEPPADAVRWSVGLFQPLLQLEPDGAVRKIIAALVFDSFDRPAPAGVRSLGNEPRQLVFRAGDVDVDVKIESVETNDRITLVGQVLSGASKFFDNTPVKLESHGIVRYKTRTNLVGEFSFDEVPKDTYHLSVDLPEGQITLFCVHRAKPQ